MYTLIVKFDINQQYWEEFEEKIMENARISFKEKGCIQFDIASSSSVSNQVMLYEIYQDHSAFKDHLETEHFRKFDSETAHMIERKVVETYNTDLHQCLKR
ncbi:MAG: putative quinol monooxygenase [Sphaerochaetaceae bacterium]|nr:putative quinol monooxygenase [Sphaerochaetaceae bacterium]